MDRNIVIIIIIIIIIYYVKRQHIKVKKKYKQAVTHSNGLSSTVCSSESQ